MSAHRELEVNMSNWLFGVRSSWIRYVFGIKPKFTCEQIVGGPSAKIMAKNLCLPSEKWPQSASDARSNIQQFPHCWKFPCLDI